MIDEQQGVHPLAKGSNSYLTEPEDFERYEAYMQGQGMQETVEAPQVQEVSDVERNFQALREKTERLERENQELKSNFEMMKSSWQKPSTPREEYKNPLDDFGQEDPLTAGVYRTREQELMARQREMEMEIQGLKNAMKYPDYNEVVEQYAAPLFKENPNLAAGFYSAPDPYKYAYDIGAMAKARMQQQTPSTVKSSVPQQHPYAQKILENAKKPGSLSHVGGQGSFQKQTLNWATMSDEDFERHYNEMQAGL